MTKTSAAWLAFLALATGSPAWAQGGDASGAVAGSAGDGSDRSRRSDVSLNFRLRSEFADLANFDESASAQTLRSRISFESAIDNGVSVLLQADHVAALGSEEFNSTANGKSVYPVVADPDGLDLNQAWLSYSGETVTVRAGRQTIRHGSERFVGGVAWRQNEQAYDGVRVLWNPAGGFDLDLAWINRVNRIFGPDDGLNPAHWKGDNYLLRANWSLAPGQRLSAFGYLLGFDPQDGYAPGRTVNNAVDSFGAEYIGEFERIRLSLSWATQQDASESQLDYQTEYYLAEVAAPLGQATLTVGYEVFGADNGSGFRMPLATLHKFQGWTDRFLATPGDGLKDAYLSAAADFGPLALVVHWHDFRAEASSADFGSEFGLSVTWPVTDRLTLVAKYATFASDEPTRFGDTDKAWLSLQMAL